ncbi:MAG: hypothetical protein LBF84_01300 [Holosporales bacterium]|nr:hypothetical protein [Holosporales bacterium]
MLFQPSCSFCKSPVECCYSICPKCWLSIKFINRRVCRFCSGVIEEAANCNERSKPFICHSCAPLLENTNRKDIISASIVYDDFIKQFILGFKHNNSIQFAKVFAKLFYRGDFIGADYIVPVPIHHLRLFKRTYNQAALLAFSLEALCDDFPPVKIQILKKRHYSPSQKKKDFQKRLDNVADSFFVPEKYAALIQQKTVVVLDDVVASGATLLECKRVLEEAGAKEVRCVALARS